MSQPGRVLKGMNVIIETGKPQSRVSDAKPGDLFLYGGSWHIKLRCSCADHNCAAIGNGQAGFVPEGHNVSEIIPANAVFVRKES